MTSSPKIRRAFLDFFAPRGHRIVASVARWSRRTIPRCSSRTPG